MACVHLVTGLVSIALVCASCGSEDDSSGGGGGTKVQTLAIGGTHSAVAPVGGSTRQVSAGGTTSGASGSTAAGGFISVLGEPNFDTLCRGDQTVGYVIGCLAVYDASFLSECVAQWEALAAICSAETEALAQCWMVQELLDHECSDDGRVVLADGLCVEQLAAIEACR